MIEQIENLNIQEDVLSLRIENKALREVIEELKLKIEKLTKHLEPQSMSALFEQVEEEVKQKQKIKELKDRNAELAGQKASLERWFGEAKEIIRKYYKYNPSCEYSYEDICKQAELFLEEVK